ncbi:hypothetical protein [Gordonia rubripertincta]|uniref:hypothetical protein n=1 Tax=Gordonia rubripertincta TaxID=36822 RepID=UPI0015FD6001|nr:hypothetical protein [Gordonia rubripertincta]QMU22889.1 hypothetical protein H3V45_10665 [Gordonia rubripertincta]
MTAPTPPDVHRIYAAGPGGRHVDLGFVDNAGVYHFRNGAKVLVNGDYIRPDGVKEGTSVVIRADASRITGGRVQDAAYPEDNAAREKHAVDSKYQDTYDANPSAYADYPAKVFTDANVRP